MFRYGADLASLFAQSACSALLGIDNGVVIRLGDGILDAPVGDSTKYSAAAAAAIADIADITHK